VPVIFTNDLHISHLANLCLICTGMHWQDIKKGTWLKCISAGEKYYTWAMHKECTTQKWLNSSRH